MSDDPMVIPIIKNIELFRQQLNEALALLSGGGATDPADIWFFES